MMNVLGVSGSSRKDKSTDRLVKEVLSAVGALGVQTEFVSLAGKTIGPCIACLGCVKDNVCKVHDDMEDLHHKIVEANAYVKISAQLTSPSPRTARHEGNTRRAFDGNMIPNLEGAS